MTGPTFLGIGAQKAGTTWLYRGLEQHPDIWLPPVKELHFFDEKIRFPLPGLDNLHGEHGPSRRWRRQLRNEGRRHRRARADDESERDRREWATSYFLGTPSLDWYRSLFDHDGPCGEITPEYATLDRPTVALAADAFPGLRVVYLLRNPIEREWSAAQMAARSGGREPSTVLRQNRRHVRYLDNIDRWAEALGPGRFYIGFYDDLRSRPDELLRDIIEFLGARPGPASPPSGRPNSGGTTTIPGPFASALAAELLPEIDRLADRLGGPVRHWAEIARTLIEQSPDEDVPYPFEPGEPRPGLASVLL